LSSEELFLLQSRAGSRSFLLVLSRIRQREARSLISHFSGGQSETRRTTLKERTLSLSDRIEILGQSRAQECLRNWEFQKKRLLCNRPDITLPAFEFLLPMSVLDDSGIPP